MSAPVPSLAPPPHPAPEVLVLAVGAAADSLVGLEALVAELETGDFEVTPTPHRALCHDCPAGPRLCSYDRDARDRRDPVPVAG